MILGDVGFLRYFAVTCDRANRTLTVRKTGDLPKAFMTNVATGLMTRPLHESRDAKKHRRRRPARGPE